MKSTSSRRCSHARATVLLAVLLGVAGCGRRTPTDIELPSTPILRTVESFAVTDAPYARLHAEPRVEAEVIYPLRRGDTVQIVRQSADRLWLEVRVQDEHGVRDGWVRADEFRQFSTAAQAQAYVRTLRGSGGAP